MTLRTSKLRTVDPPKMGSVVHAPPVIQLSSNTTQYLCGGCGTLLLVADPGQVHGVVIQCKACGSYNEADI